MSDAARFADRLAAFLAAKEDAYDDASGTGCALKASWTSASTMYAWLYPDACCGASVLACQACCDRN